MSLAIVCFFWQNSAFRAHYNVNHVNNLYSMVKRHVDQEFTFYVGTPETRIESQLRSGIKVLSLEGCPTFDPRVTGENLGSWPVLNMFKPYFQERIEEENILKLDLDCVITNSLEPLIEKIQPGKIVGWLDISHKILNPSFALFKSGFGFNIWENFLAKPEEVQSMIASGHADKFGWDQAWLNHQCPEDKKIFLTKEAGVFHRREIDKHGKLPSNARIVYFNSSHKPWHENMKLTYPWIKNHYK